MKYLVILFLTLAGHLQVKAQASYDTNIAFILRNDKNEKIDLKTFKKEYQIANVFGNIVPEEQFIHCLSYDEKTGYFILDITTIGPRYSFALYHNNSSMIIYLPFNHDNNYYALDFKFRAGTYLFDFSTKNKEKLYLNGNMPYYVIDRINWKKQHKRLTKSNYANDQTYKLKRNEEK